MVIKPQPIGNRGAWSQNVERGDKFVDLVGNIYKAVESRGWGKRQRGELTPQIVRCPYGVLGDAVWVKETWARFKGNIFFRAEGSNNARIEEAVGWTSAYFLHKEDARLWLKITNVKVEQRDGRWFWVIEFKRIEKPDSPPTCL